MKFESDEFLLTLKEIDELIVKSLLVKEKENKLREKERGSIIETEEYKQKSLTEKLKMLSIYFGEKDET